MALRYCFEQSYVARTIAKSKPKDLAVIDRTTSPIRHIDNYGPQEITFLLDENSL